MDEDKLAAIRWLLGREAEPKRGEPPSKGQAALVRLLRADDPLDRDVRNALANGLEPIGSSQWKLALRLEKRGPGRPSNDVALARKRLTDAEAIVTDIQKGEKLYVAVEKRGGSKKAAYEALDLRKMAILARTPTEEDPAKED